MWMSVISSSYNFEVAGDLTVLSLAAILGIGSNIDHTLILIGSHLEMPVRRERINLVSSDKMKLSFDFYTESLRGTVRNSALHRNKMPRLGQNSQVLTSFC